MFFNDSRAVGVLLIGCTILSLFITNYFVGSTYREFWQKDILAASVNLPRNAGHWINDFLMSFFFLMAGMEIKRELLSGELSSFKKAILPFGAALGGMIVPAVIFLLFNASSGFQHGWGIPTATDIAFSLGIASLLGKRVPVGLKILLMAIAIIDDLGAIVVIALFYGGKLQMNYLSISGVIYLVLWACNFFKIKLWQLQAVLSLALWYTVYNTGIEAGITGVLVAFAVPVNSTPKILKLIHKPVNFFILPLFALANTAILIPSNISQALNSTISLGVLLGLVIGKPIGILLFSRVMVGLKVAKLPSSTNWGGVLGMGTLAGIGFTMSIFTTTLAFASDAAIDLAKIAILAAMVTSLVLSWMYFILYDKQFSFSESRKAIPEASIAT